MENTSLLVAIIQNAIDGIITTDDQGNIELINPSACKLFDYLPEEVIGKNVAMLMPFSNQNPSDGNSSYGEYTWQQYLTDNVVEIQGLKKDGTVFPFRLGVSEVQFFGRQIYTGFIHDLSREKEAEHRLEEYAAHLEQQVKEQTQSLKNTVQELRQAKEDVSQSLKKEKELSQLKSRFVSMASHEFRTPLSAVQLSASLINKYAQPFKSENIRKHVGKIKNAVVNLTSILNDFLSLENLEAGKQEVLFSNFDLVKLSEEITEEMLPVVKRYQNIVYRHKGTSRNIKLDPSLLKNCIVNLIGNAIKYSGENTFIYFNTEINGECYIIKVSDNGIGIPEPDQKHLFEPFFRAHNTENIPGTGLGLNIVARYTQLMGGTVNFKSRVNQGTSFTLSFPVL